tara:strand:+ start:272 stop:616 length:345 start_codon:yes stop_codon:yes gene_type:complete
MFMPTDRNYTNLTVNRERSEKYRGIYEALKINQSFNTWVLDLIESGLDKMKFLKENFPDLAFAQLDGEGFAIVDKSKDQIFRIYYNGKKLSCSKHGQAICDHKLYASFHPKFIG